MTALVVPQEFRRVQAEYPILFRRTGDGEAVVALALFGFESGENLYLEGDRWDADYVPLAHDIQPFLIGGSPDAEGAQVHLDAASPRLGDPEGVRVFDADGRPTKATEGFARSCGIAVEQLQHIATDKGERLVVFGWAMAESLATGKLPR